MGPAVPGTWCGDSQGGTQLSFYMSAQAVAAGAITVLRPVNIEGKKELQDTWECKHAVMSWDSTSLVRIWQMLLMTGRCAS